MLGFYDYTVLLTYFSLISAGFGIIMAGSDCPYIGLFCLLFCGLCDAFDGLVARTKKNRTVMEKNFGIQIDSLSDLVAFGVLPTSIGASLIRNSAVIHINHYILYCVLVLYILAALIRLAYFNVTEEERQTKEASVRKVYTGLPVTSASLIFPVILITQYILSTDLTLVYIIVMFLTALAFLLKFNIKKPGLKGILLLVLLGIIECFFLCFFK